MGSKDDNLGTSTRDRLKAMMTVKAAANRIKSEGQAISAHGQRQSFPLEEARAIVEGWPDAPRSTAEKLLSHYGAPNEGTPTKLFWYAVAPWTRMEISADEVVHNFPTPHVDYVTQYLFYRVPAARAGDLIAFDGSVIIDRTTGELGVRCDDEAFNTLTFNLAVEIIDGRRTVEQARELYAETAAAYAMGRDAPYAEGLLFAPQDESAADPDESIIAPQMVEQMMEKAKDLFGAGETPR
jgi:hypothetical protein